MRCFPSARLSWVRLPFVALLLQALLFSTDRLDAKEPPSKEPPVANKPTGDASLVAGQHSEIDIVEGSSGLHTNHPDAQWFPEAGLGLFLHWGISSVDAMNISHPMVVGRPLEKHRITDAKEIKRIVAEQDYYLNGKKPEITPDDYFAFAKSFNPDSYDPEAWLTKVKAAGFKYVVLTAKHHEGFAMWPSKYGDFNTKNYMGGRDLIKEFVDACHKLDLKVGALLLGARLVFRS